MKNQHNDKVSGSAGVPLLERTSVLAAIDDEPELTGEAPAEMLAAIHEAIKNNDVDFLIDMARITVRLTKQCIRDRVCAL